MPAARYVLRDEKRNSYHIACERSEYISRLHSKHIASSNARYIESPQGDMSSGCCEKIRTLFLNESGICGIHAVETSVDALKKPPRFPAAASTSGLRTSARRAGRDRSSPTFAAFRISPAPRASNCTTAGIWSLTARSFPAMRSAWGRPSAGLPLRPTGPKRYR